MNILGPKKFTNFFCIISTSSTAVQNCFQDTEQQPDSGSGKQPEIKKEPLEELEPESNLPIKMNKGFVFPKPVPSVIPVINKIERQSKTASRVFQN